jgi:hypothetical protein
MERRINKKIENYFADFKDKVKERVSGFGMSSDINIINIMQYIYDYEGLVLIKEDFMKRKRVKNVVILADRCCAKRASNEQCTRRKKEGCEYCGTHLKGTPHGMCDMEDDTKPQGKKVEVWAQDIQGIIYYIDKTNNVYQAEDIMHGKINPKVIAKYVKVLDIYSIPEFNI